MFVKNYPKTRRTRNLLPRITGVVVSYVSFHIGVLGCDWFWKTEFSGLVSHQLPRLRFAP
jgi:hypothetical protein